MDNIIHKIIRTIFFIVIIIILRILLPNLKSVFNLIKLKLKLAYRLNLDKSKQELTVWKDLIKLHKSENWNYTIHEKSYCLESIVPINENTFNRFFYMIYGNKFHSSVKLLYDYPDEIATEIFILAMHINNILNDGIISINTEKNYVEYTKKESILTTLLVPNQLKNQIILHYEASVKMQWAFYELLKRKEEPLIVFAEFMRRIEPQEKD